MRAFVIKTKPHQFKQLVREMSRSTGYKVRVSGGRLCFQKFIARLFSGNVSFDQTAFIYLLTRHSESTCTSAMLLFTIFIVVAGFHAFMNFERSDDRSVDDENKRARKRQYWQQGSPMPRFCHPKIKSDRATQTQWLLLLSRNLLERHRRSGRGRKRAPQLCSPLDRIFIFVESQIEATQKKRWQSSGICLWRSRWPPTRSSSVHILAIVSFELLSSHIERTTNLPGDAP